MYILSHSWALIQATNFYLTCENSFKLDFFFLNLWYFFFDIYTKHNIEYLYSYRILGEEFFFVWLVIGLVLGFVLGFFFWDIVTCHLKKLQSHLNEPSQVCGRTTIQWVSRSLLSSVRKLKLFSWLSQKGISLILMRTFDPITLLLISPIKHIIYFFSLFTELTCLLPFLLQVFIDFFRKSSLLQIPGIIIYCIKFT